MLGIEPRVLCIWNSCSTSELRSTRSSPVSFMSSRLKILKFELGVVVHVCNAMIWEAEAEGLQSLRLAFDSARPRR